MRESILSSEAPCARELHNTLSAYPERDRTHATEAARGLQNRLCECQGRGSGEGGGGRSISGTAWCASLACRDLILGLLSVDCIPCWK